MGNNRIDDSILATVIYGRIEPKIYAFETATIPNYLKVGDTFRTVQERLNEWRNAGFKDLRKVGDWSAEIKGKDIYFRDYAVHEYLEPQHKRLTKDVFPGRPYSQEFFKNASKKDVEDAIRDIVTSYGQTGTNYTYYGIKERTAIESVYPRDPFDWEPKNPLQTDAISKFEVALENDRANLLMYAVMRFGKSFTSLCCAKAMKAKFVLVVSGKADVADEWKENVQRPGQFENFVFFNSRSLKKNDKLLSDAKKDINKCIVLFLTLQDLSKEKERFKELFESQIDLMIIDETHFGARAETLGKVIADAHYQKDSHLEEIEKSDGIKNESLSSLQRDKAEKELEKATKGLNVKVKLHLSGTPYRILMGSEFEKDDIISFCQYSDIISEKERWYKENIADGRQEETGKEEWENPYYGFPQMVRFAFSLNRSAMNKIKELKEKGYSYHLSALFAPRSVEKDDKREYRKFVYESEVLDFLQAIDGYKSDNNILSFLDNQRIKDGKLCRHIVMVLPYCASCDAMEALIAEKKSEFSNLSEYEIINISGIDSKYNKISEVKSKIKSCESKNIKTITLTVNRMLTGCTVPEWDTMIFLKDTASPQDYDQAIFRLQSQYVVEYEGTKIVDGKEIKLSMKKDMKPQTLLIDFDPQRMYYLQETKSRVYNINTKDGGNEESEQRIKRDLEVSPIIHISENKLVEVTPTDVLKAVSEYSVNRGITEAAKDIIVDTNLINIDSIKRIIDKEFEITSGKGLTDQTYKEETDLDDDDIKTNGDAVNTDKTDSKDPTGSEKGTTEKETACRIFINKCRSYYRRILFYAFLCKSEEEIKSLNDVLESVSTPENERIFRNLGMNKGFIKLMKKNMSGSALRSLDDKIFDLYRLSHEYDKENNDPIQRATTAINRFGKISDSEVVTPQHIAKEMVDQIPEKDFKKVFEGDDKILDIASKMGEFATAVYRRAVSLNISIDNIRNKIYSIPTSPLWYNISIVLTADYSSDRLCLFLYNKKVMD
ncbi:Type III restriction enzyme, res subunit [Ruminococcaceae bacterium FB2012]|nr:Type III restriction enzyme, res subunit [Ruminococcaceae bacterium FB2012]